MSLDLYITRKIESAEGVYEETVFDRHITHNLGEMASNIKHRSYNLYQLLWRPEESGFTKVDKCYINSVTECLAFMVTHRKELSVYNPDNGWGSYDGLLDFTIDLCTALSKWDSEEVWEIHASR